MANEISTVQSLKAVDAWIDVINANINGGVRTAFKTSRLKFGGNNANVARAGNTTSLPLQFPEAGLATANTVIDFSQGAVTTSTENTHLAIQGNGFFLLATPQSMDTNPASPNYGATVQSAAVQFYLTRDGEFHTDSHGFLVNADGMYLVSVATANMGAGVHVLWYETTFSSQLGSPIRCVTNDLDQSVPVTAGNYSVRLTNFLANNIVNDVAGFAIAGASVLSSTLKLSNGMQSLKYTRYGSTVFDFGYRTDTGGAFTLGQKSVTLNFDNATASDSTILSKSLEASNASMTQSVPELSLAQKLFSALTKVLQVGQTNTDAVINLIR